MLLVYFVYGLAFFSMGFAIALESRKSSGLRIASALPFLAAFGLLHSLVEWSDLLILAAPVAPSSLDLDAVRLFRIILLGVSTVALVQFGVGLVLATGRPSPRPSPTRGRGERDGGWGVGAHGVRPARPNLRALLRMLPLGLGAAWVVSLLLLSSEFPIGSRQWVIHGDIWARYLLYLPGSLLAALGLLLESRLLVKSDFRQIGLDARLAAVTFAVNGLVAGVVVPPGQQFPTSPLNYDNFTSTFGFPVQLLRAASAVAIAFFVLRVLRVFRLQSARRVERATVEERERLAREMHDSLAQVIGLLGIKTRSIERLLANGKLDEAESELGQIQGIIQETYADVRQSIQSLRTATGPERGFIDTIRETASDFAEQNATQVELVLAEEDNVSFPTEAKLQLVRIVQEALANVRKHSRAGRVTIRLDRIDHEAVLSVEDNGVGFAQDRQAEMGRRCFGLETMRERAESVGARFQVTSIPGEGTRVEVRVSL